MKGTVAFMIGENSQVIINQQLSVLNDTVEFFTYADFPTLINISKSRGRVFDRILFTSKPLSKGDVGQSFKELSTFIGDTNKATKVVFIAQPSEEDLAKKFNDVFQSPNTVVVSPKDGKDISVRDLQKFITSEIDGLRTEYPENFKKSKGTSKKPTKKKGGGFFDLFKKKEEPEPEPEVVEEELIEEEPEIDLDSDNLALGGLAGTGADTGYFDEESFEDLQKQFQEPVSQLKKTPEEVKPVERVIPKPVAQKSPVRPTVAPRNVSGSGKVVSVELVERVLILADTFDWRNISAKDQNTVYVDLDFEGKNLMRQLGLPGDLTTNATPTRLYDGYYHKDPIIRGEKLENLLRKDNRDSVAVACPVHELGDIARHLRKFDRVVIYDNYSCIDLDFAEPSVVKELRGILKVEFAENSNVFMARKFW